MRRLGPINARILAQLLGMLCALGSGTAVLAEAPPAAEVAFFVVDPPLVKLRGPDARWSLLVEGVRRDGRKVDLTSEARFASQSPKVASVSPSGVVLAVGDGETVIEVSADGQTQQVHVSVAGSHERRQFNFENDIVPLLSKFGCNSSGCHGKAEGQNGFKLSVFGFDPQADYDALTKEGRGRRVSPAAPDSSLLLTKASGQSPHGGGVRLKNNTPEFAIVRDWIAAGLPRGSDDDPKVASITVTPRQRTLNMHARQRLRVVARYTDGREVDVTALAKFQSNRDVLAAVDESGLVTVGEVPGQAAVMAAYMGAVDVFQVLVPRVGASEATPALPEHNFIDGLVDARLRELNITPSTLADDAEFLRRVSLDLIGTLPTADEARAFQADPRPDRRARLVEDLFERTEFADYWALKWADLLQVDRAKLGHKGAYAFYRWIRDSQAENKPVDEFVREIVTASGAYADTPASRYFQSVTKPGEEASAVSQVFLGVRIACAECHHHPFDRWSQHDYYGMAAFFAPLARQPSPRGEALVATGSPQMKHARTGEAVWAHALGEPTPEKLEPGEQRAELARWLTDGRNPYFARHLANRLWAHFLGRGLVEPVDDVRATNPPTNPELLDALAEHLVKYRFDQRELMRAIVSSRTYQLSSHPNATNSRDDQAYSRALLKRVDAEVLLDAVCQTTGVPEKFAGVSSGYRAVQLWDSRVSHYFLKLFGRPVRQTACECERSVEPSVAQVLHCLNGPDIQAKLSHDAGRIRALESRLSDDLALVNELYLTFYSRYPTATERSVATAHLKQSSAGRRRAAEDLAWTMLNSLEFVFNH